MACQCVSSWNFDAATVGLRRSHPSNRPVCSDPKHLHWERLPTWAENLIYFLNTFLPRNSSRERPLKKQLIAGISVKQRAQEQVAFICASGYTLTTPLCLMSESPFPFPGPSPPHTPSHFSPLAPSLIPPSPTSAFTPCLGHFHLSNAIIPNLSHYHLPSHYPHLSHYPSSDLDHCPPSQYVARTRWRTTIRSPRSALLVSCESLRKTCQQNVWQI